MHRAQDFHNPARLLPPCDSPLDHETSQNYQYHYRLLGRGRAIYSRRLCVFADTWLKVVMDRSRARVFLAHLLPALKNVYRQTGGCCGSSTLKRKQGIRLAADMCLAQTANEITGSGWSRALNLRLHRKIMKQALSSIRSRSKPMKKRNVCVTAVRRLRVVSLKPKNVDVSVNAVERRVRTLQRVVPGGRDMKSIDLLFQETADYIVNLQMQVNTMQALADFCSSECPDRRVEGEFHSKCSALQLVS